MRYPAGMVARQTTLEYVPALDGLRALAAISVVAFHVRAPGFSGGFIGVEVFFVLSGYLITSLLKREIDTADGVHIGRFWRKRIVRLYPELLMMLLCGVIAAIALGRLRDVSGEVLAAGLYMSNYAAALAIIDPSFTRHTWSLAVEMQFYLAWPFVALALARLRRDAAVLCLVLLFGAATLWRMHAQSILGADYGYLATDARMSGLVMGSLLAFCGWRPGLRNANAIASMSALALVAAVACLSFSGPLKGMWPTPAIDVACAVLILAVSERGCWFARLLAHPIAVQLGVWSYGIYLWHYPLARIARQHLGPWMALVTVLLASVALSALSFRYIACPAKHVLSRRPIPQLRLRRSTPPH